MGFDLNSYVEVKDRIAEFYMGYPEGSIRTYLVKQEGKEVVFEARVYRTNDEAVAGIYTSGFARELEGDGMVNKTSHVENCETSAIGRALANLNYCGSVAGQKAPRPSREEMQKAERMGGSARNYSDPGERTMPFGKTKGKKLKDLSADELTGARDWCLDKDAGKFADLIGDLNAGLASKLAPVGAGDEADDELPF